MKKILTFLDNRVQIRETIYDYNDFYNLYVTQNLPLKKIKQHLQLSEASVLKIIKFFDIHKPKKLARDNYKESMLELYGVDNPRKMKVEEDEQHEQGAMREQDKDYVHWNSKYPGEVFDVYYQTHSQKECAEYFHVSISAVQNWVKRHKVFKPKPVKSPVVKIYKTPEELAESRARAWQKTKETNMARYGVQSTLSLPEVKEKIKQTNLKKYGFEIATKSEIVKERTKQHNIEKYGVGVPHQSQIQDFQCWENDEKFADFVKTHSMSIYEIAEYFCVTHGAIDKRINRLGLQQYINLLNGTSRYENEIVELLIKMGVAPEDIYLRDRTVLEGKEIDIYLPKYKLGIEFNGNYWHSDCVDNYTDHNGRSTKHQEKSLAAQQKGVFIFHIFEYEWNDPRVCLQIKNRLSTLLRKNAVSLGARKCQIVSLSKEQKKDFLEHNHIQGNDSCTIALGLIYQEELVACMTFRKSKYKKYTWELSRFCCKNGYNVCGAANKIFSWFLATYSKPGEVVVSYNDITKTKGELYTILGFTSVSINAPNYVWINFKTGDIKTRYQTQESKEVQRMHNLDYHRVCDCGTQTWVYHNTGVKG